MSLLTYYTAAAPCLSLGDADPYKALPAPFLCVSSIVKLHFITRDFCLFCREAGVGALVLKLTQLYTPHWAGSCASQQCSC